jgi:hypothetical protein
MSTKTRLLTIALILVPLGIAVIVIGVSEGGALGSFIVFLGVLVWVHAIVLAIATMRWLRPSTRLPVHLRAPVPAATWRRSPVTLQLRDGSRVLCIAVLPGGYVPPRKTDPRFDVREVVAVSLSTEAECATEGERQAGKQRR